MICSGAMVSRSKLCGWHCHKASNNLEHHGQALDFTSVFKSWPLEMLHHGSDTAAVLVVIRHRSCSSPIDSLELVSILLGVRIPDSQTEKPYSTVDLTKVK